MTGNTPDFVAIGGPTSPAAFAALTAVRLGRSAGVLVADSLPAYERETLVSVGVEVAFGPPQLRAEHIPWSWLDAEIVLAAQSDDEVDSAMLGRFGRSLIGLIARGSEAAGHQPSPLAPGAGALFFAEPDAQADRIAAPIALSLGLNGRPTPVVAGSMARHRVRPTREARGQSAGPGRHRRRLPRASH